MHCCCSTNCCTTHAAVTCKCMHCSMMAVHSATYSGSCRATAATTTPFRNQQCPHIMPTALNSIQDARRSHTTYLLHVFCIWRPGRREVCHPRCWHIATAAVRAQPRAGALQHSAVRPRNRNNAVCRLFMPWSRQGSRI
jgi:hypothetical protein